MITEATTRCGACQAVLDGDEKSCPSCGRTRCPRISEWPEGWRRLLFLMLIVDALATKLNVPEQFQMEWLLRTALAGRWIRGELVSYAATEAECYEAFARLCAAWQELGAPTDFTAIAQLRGAHR